MQSQARRRLIECLIPFVVSRAGDGTGECDANPWKLAARAPTVLFVNECFVIKKNDCRQSMRASSIGLRVMLTRVEPHESRHDLAAVQPQCSRAIAGGGLVRLRSSWRSLGAHGGIRVRTYRRRDTTAVQPAQRVGRGGVNIL